MGNSPTGLIDLTGLSPEINLFDKSDRLYHQHELILDTPSVIDVAGHGNNKALVDQRGGRSKSVTPADLAKEILSLPGVDPNKPIEVRLHACNAGTGVDSFAEQLVKLLPNGSVVWAPNGFCHPVGRAGLALPSWGWLTIVPPTWDGEYYSDGSGGPAKLIPFIHKGGGTGGGKKKGKIK